MHLDVDPKDRKRLRYQRPYPIAQVNQEVFYKELQRLVQLGVLEEVDGLVDYAAPTFIIPKKDGTVRWVSDFRELNKIIRRKVYPLPHINRLLRKRSGYSFLTKLDVSMQFYTFELDEESQDLCVISTPFGNYRYKRAPMGIKQTPDFAQQVMEQSLRGLDEAEAYLDDIAVFGKKKGSFDDHLQSLEQVLTRLQDNNFTINPLKCEWAVQETDFLGFWLTPHGLKPWKKKVQAILDLEPPKSVSQTRSFIGAVTFYREMFPHRSHILTPLYQLTESKRKRFFWTPECDVAFRKIKAMLAKDILIRYPDPNKPFHVYTDASDLQLGAVIMQDNKPVAYFSRKLNSAQKNYTTMEKELLSIVTTLHEYRTMLYGVRELHIHTDHKNLTYANLNSQRVLRWRLFLEEFNPTFHYIEGTANTLADALSRLSIKEGQGCYGPYTSNSNNKFSHDLETSMHARTESGTLDSFYSLLVDDDELLECLLAGPEEELGSPFLLDYDTIASKQRAEGCHNLLESDAKHYSLEPITLDGTPLVVYKAYTSARPRIRIPDSMLEDIVQYYHLALSHVGMVRLQRTIAANFIHPRLNQVCMKVALKCETCQKTKLFGKGYGHLPPRQAKVAPWQEVAVDLIGPWSLYDPDGNEHTFTALTVVDTVTTYCEVVLLRNKTAAHVGYQFETQWLNRYPKPDKCIFDQGNEFLGEDFQAVLRKRGVKPAGTTVKNPQANAVCERLHQSVGNTLRVLNYNPPPATEVEAAERVNTALQTAAYAARTAIHTTMQEAPGSLAYHRDMILNIPLQVDFEIIRQRRQALIDKNLLKANAKRIDYNYQPGQMVLKEAPADKKLDLQAEGPYEITKVFTNGSVEIKISPILSERINIRRIKPYRQ
jgi:transposase InsO family protein